MSSDQWTDLFRTLGVAAPLVGVLAYMLREATRERQEITTKFLIALQTTVDQSNEARIRSGSEFAALTQAVTEHQARSEEEHGRIVKALDRLSGWDGHDRRRELA